MTRKIAFFLILSFATPSLLSSPSSYPSVIDLDGIWSIESSNKSITVNGTMPGGVHLALFNAGLIPDPYHAFNDVNLRWIVLDTWTLSRTFEVDSKTANSSTTLLILEGVDTFATVRVNGHVAVETENMFIPYLSNVAPLLKVGTNVISVEFASSVQVAHDRAAEYAQYMPPECPPAGQHGECHVNFVRKEQCSFSWDWGPAFAPIGIWQPAWLLSFEGAYLRTIHATVTLQNDTWLVLLEMDFLLSADITTNAPGTATITLGTTPPLKTILGVSVSKSALRYTTTLPVPSTLIDRWWPNGYGSQTLYDLEVQFYDLRSQITSTATKRIGFRTVELVQEPVQGSVGLSYYFRVNDLPIFMKGSNWIPADAFQERVTPQRLTVLLQSAQLAHMNMFRVWGGGIYEQERFYELADELGIAIWQDMMFGCALYPVDQGFLGSVQSEISYQIDRLKSHPSVLTWSGNNENEAALAEDWYQTKASFEQYADDYRTLYIGTVMPIVQKQDATRPFVSSSPTNGVESQTENWIAKDPQSPLYGDVHHYDYFADGWDWQTYPTPRFASEYGFQSWPSFETIQQVSSPSDWSIFSAFSSQRQHHDDGNIQQLMMVARHMNLPTNQNDTVNYANILYVSQINQAVAIKTETEHYRRLRDNLLNGQGHCMGALYWQLNDIWQAPTWASIEYGEKWKMLHYYAIKFNSPLLVSPFEDSAGVLRVMTVSDSTVDMTSLLLNVSVYKWNSMTPTNVISVPFDQPALNSTTLLTRPTAQLLNGLQREEAFIVATVTNDGEYLVSDNWVLLSSFQEAIGIEKATVEVTSVIALHDRLFLIDLSTDHIAPFVWVEAIGVRGYFSYNGFMMVTPTTSMFFTQWDDAVEVTADELRASLRVTSLTDIYEEPSDRTMHHHHPHKSLESILLQKGRKPMKDTTLNSL